MEFIELFTLPELNLEINSRPAVLLYFSTTHCSVCKVLKPKLLLMLKEEYPEFGTYYIDIEKSRLIAGQMSIFTIPTVLVFFGGKEFYRISRNFSVEELKKTIDRPYSLLF